MIRFWLVASCLSLLAVPASASCTLEQLTSFDATLDTHRIVMKGLIDGRPVTMMLDTGTPFNLISQELAEKLGLPITRKDVVYASSSLPYLKGRLDAPGVPPEDIQMLDRAGRSPKKIAYAHTVAFGKLATEGTPFYVMDNGSSRTRADAIIGSNFLERYDVEFDLGHGKVNVFLPNHCKGNAVYWSRDFGTVPIQTLDNGDIVIPIALNGVDSHAVVDTGSAISMVGKILAEQSLGVDPPADGSGEFEIETSGARLAFYRHTFDSIDFGGIHFNQTEFGIARNERNWILKNAVHDPSNPLMHAETVNAPVTLGMSHLEKLRLYFSFGERTIYVTRADAS